MSFTPEFVDPEAPFSERLLVCEGECNPEIHEYNEAINQHRAYIINASADAGPGAQRKARMMINTIADWVRRLKHTPHIPETPHAIFRYGNWCRAWRCVKCGTRRYY